MFEFEGHIHGKEIESKLECLAIGKYFLQLEVGADDCVHFTWNPLSGSGDFSCDAMADCITTSEAVQDALTNFIQTNDFTLEGERTFNNTVQFNDGVLFTAEVTFEGGPVNFSKLEINWDQVTWNVDDSVFNIENSEINFIESNITLDANSVFTNNGETILNGPTTIENLTVTNFVLGPGSDLSGMISTDGSNCLTVGSDGGLYIACGGGSFSCDDVADCIDNNANVQSALDNWIIDAITNDANVQAAFDAYIGTYLTNAGITPFACSDVADCIDNDANVQAALDNWFIDAITNDANVQSAVQSFIEGADLTITGDWIFNGSVTFNGAVSGISGGSGVVADKIETYVAAESITLGDHVSQSYYEEEYTVDANNIKSITSANVGVPVTVNYGEAFEWNVTGPVEQLMARLRISTVSESGGASQQTAYSLQAKIYAISGVYGTTAVNTGAALLTSTNTVSGTVTFANVVLNPIFNFDGITNLPAGQYAMKIEGTITSNLVNNSGVIRFYGDNTGGYSGNAIDNVTAVAGDDLSFNIVSTPIFAVVSDASDSDRLKYLGQATESKLVGENILVKTRGTIAQTGATINAEIRYLSDTPGDIANTPGTNLVFVGKGIAANQVGLRGLADFAGEEFVDNFTLSGASANYSFYTAGGGILNYDGVVSLGGSSSVNLQTQISEDGTTRRTLAQQQTDGGHTMRSWNNSFSVPSDRFVRLLRTRDVGAGTFVANNLVFTPF